MIYYVNNKSSILDPIIEALHDKYFKTCVVYWGVDAKERIKQPPFFSDRWLLVIEARDLLDKENKKVLTNRFVDIMVDVSTEDEFNKVFSYAENVISEHCIELSKSLTKYSKEWNIPKEEVEEVIENFQKKKYFNSYKVSDKYLETYIKWFLFTREGNQYGIKENLPSGERWQRASEMQLQAVNELNLKSLVKLVRGNESRLLTVLNLVGSDILSLNFIRNSSEYFTKPKYVTVNNFPLYLFAKDKRKKKEILNLVYSYSYNVGLLKKSILEFCDTFEIIYTAFSRGELSIKNKDDWFSNKGYELKINSSFKANLWWRCVNTMSLEKIYIVRDKINKDSFKTYEYIVGLCRKEL